MITQELANQARKDIFEFVEEVHRMLRQVVNEPYGENGELLVLKEMQAELRDAWVEFDEDFSLDRARARIFETPPETLQSHGLYGAQLRAKLGLFGRRLTGFFSNRKKKTLLWLIDAADTTIRSVVSATGLDAALEELKDLLRNSIDEGN